MTFFVVGALGCRFGVSVSDPRVARACRAVVGGLVVDSSRRCDGRIVVGGVGPWWVSSLGFCGQADSLEEAVAGVLTAINLSAVASTRLLAFHAAVVAKGDRVVVFPAASGVGKSTLTAFLVRHLGWRYVSDEALVCGWRWSDVVAYPRPLSLSSSSMAAVGVAAGVGVLAAGEEFLVAPEVLGECVSGAVGPVTDVVLLARGEGDQPVLEHAAGGTVMAALLQRSFTHFLRPALAMSLVAQLCDRAGTYQLVAGSVALTARRVDAHFSAATSTSASVCQ